MSWRAGLTAIRAYAVAGGGHLLRDTWGLEQLQHLAQQQAQQAQLPCRQRRGLDSLSGVTFGGAKKRFNSLNGGTFGTNKRNFDEIDRTSFNSFTKKNFDEIDRAGFDSFVKRNPAAMPELDDLERPLYGIGLAARLHHLQEQEQP